MIKSTGIIRKVDELGRIVLPIQSRRSLDISESDSLEVMIDEDNGRIVLQKVEKKCVCCQTISDLRVIKPGLFICKKCLQELNS